MNKPRGERPTVAVITIATNKYIHYWEGMANSLDQYLSMNNDVTFRVYTDQPKEISEIASKLTYSKIEIFEIPSWKWPEVALKRYEVINGAIPSIEQDYLIYIDADMIALSEIPSVTDILGNRSIALTLHPGFWRPVNFEKTFLYLKYLMIATRDLRMRLRLGGLGAWECNTKSHAYIPRRDRRHYFCGGFWLGRKGEIEDQTRELMFQTSKDAQSGVEAKWLDESHLNRWAVTHEGEFKTLTPEYCFDRTYSQLSNLIPKIEAVNKATHQLGNSIAQ